MSTNNLAAAVAAIVLAGSAGVAQAAHPASEAGSPVATTVSAAVPAFSAADQGLTEEGYRALLRDLRSAGYGTPDGGATVRTEAGSMVLAAPPAESKGGPQKLGGGWDGWQGPYVTFNRTEQGMLLAGASAGLATAICGIPAVGQAACVAAVAIIAAATYYVNESGRCPTARPNLRVYVWGSKTGCYR